VRRARKRGVPVLVAPQAKAPTLTIEEAGRIADEMRYVLNFAETMITSLSSALNAVRIRSMAPEADSAIGAVIKKLEEADKTIREKRNAAHHAICQRALDAQRKRKNKGE